MHKIQFISIWISLSLLSSTSFTISRPSHPLYVRSITDLQELARFENDIAKHFTLVYLSSETLNHDSEMKRLVETYLLDFYETSGFADVEDAISTNDLRVSHNPICGYRLIRRVIFFLRRLASRPLFFRTFGELARNIFLFFWDNGWPSVKDVLDALHGIFKIQETHDFDVDQFANGRISDIHTNCTFDSISCQGIANAFMRIKDIASRIQWLDIAVAKSAQDRKTSVPFLQIMLMKSIRKHNMDFDEDTMMEFGDKWFDREIQGISGDGRRAKKLRTLRYETLKERRKLSGEIIDYWAICSGENFQAEGKKSRLFCWYEFKAHGSLAIGPGKMEFLSRNPDVVQIYDVLSEKETQGIIFTSALRMYPSAIQYSEPGGAAAEIETVFRNDDEKRISMTGRLSEAKTTRLINQRVDRIVGLDVVDDFSAEKLQVVSYTFAGYVEPHNDESNERPYERHRIATFMFYFNDVKAGGQTSFPFLGFAAHPIKGSAIFWYNLYSDGRADELTTHGSCPVLYGEKWIGTKWIWVAEQFRRRKCDFEPRKRHYVLVNGVVRK